MKIRDVLLALTMIATPLIGGSLAGLAVGSIHEPPLPSPSPTTSMVVTWSSPLYDLPPPDYPGARYGRVIIPFAEPLSSKPQCSSYTTATTAGAAVSWVCYK